MDENDNISESLDTCMDDYDYEYEDLNEELNDQEILISDEYYDTKGKITTEPEASLSGFAALVRMSPNNAKGCFKALKRTVQIYCSQGEHKKMMDAYREMLKYINCNYVPDSIDKIMDLVSNSFSQNLHLLEELYQTTLGALEENKRSSHGLWFRTNLKLCNILFDSGKYPQISKILKELHKYCQKKDGTYDQNKGSELFEVYANEFQLYTETKDNKDLKMQQLYQKALSVKFDTCAPRVIGILHECGGKMHMAERQWEEAAIVFRKAFINYAEAGNRRRIQCLKYGLLVNMMGSKVNIFDLETAKPYENDPEILAMKGMIEAYQKNDFAEFERILNSNWKTIMDDPFIETFMEDQDMLKKMRTQVLLNLIKANTKIEIRFISAELGVSETKVTELLRSLIVDSQIDASIDEINGYLLRGDSAMPM